MHRWTVAVLAGVLLVVGTAVALSAGDWISPGETRHQPTGIAFLGQGGDPLVILVEFDWPHDGWCSGQFTVGAAEDATQVRIYEVVSRTVRPGASCAGLGSDGVHAYADLTLAAPFGTRTAVRASDDMTLPIRHRGP